MNNSLLSYLNDPIPNIESRLSSRQSTIRLKNGKLFCNTQSDIVTVPIEYRLNSRLIASRKRCPNYIKSKSNIEFQERKRYLCSSCDRNKHSKLANTAIIQNKSLADYGINCDFGRNSHSYENISKQLNRKIQLNFIQTTVANLNKSTTRGNSEDHRLKKLHKSSTYHIKNSYKDHNSIIATALSNSINKLPLRPSSQYAKELAPLPSYLQNLRIIPIQLERPITQLVTKRGDSNPNEVIFKKPLSQNQLELFESNKKIRAKILFEANRKVFTQYNTNSYQCEVENSCAIDSRKKLSMTDMRNSMYSSADRLIGVGNASGIEGISTTPNDIIKHTDNGLGNIGPWDHNDNNDF